MFFFPYSTDAHDGKIRLAGVQIIIICFLVHVVFMVDKNRALKELDILTQESIQEAKKLTENPSRFTARKYEELSKNVQSKIEEIRRSTLAYKFGFVAAEKNIVRVFTSLFVHSGIIHLLGNMLFFYVVGIAMEQYWGYWRFMVSYLLCGLFATFFFYITTLLAPGGELADTPLVGASGAIAGIMGAFVVTQPKTKVHVLLMLLWFKHKLKFSAFLYFGFWFSKELISLLSDLSFASGVAHSAHVGGFATGIALGFIFKSEDEGAKIKHKSSGGSFETVERDSESDDRIWWKSYQKGELAAARHSVCGYLDRLMRDPHQNRDRIGKTVDAVLDAADDLGISESHLYIWGKTLIGLNLSMQAIRSFDQAALVSKNQHIRLNSMLESGEIRIKNGIEIAKAIDNLNTVISEAPEGVSAGTAKTMLQGVSDVTQAS